MLTVHFYDVGQGLAALVDLPDGRHILVDAGPVPAEDGCATKPVAHASLVARIARDLAGAPIDMLWITHPHADHVGGAPRLLACLRVASLAYNGRVAHSPDAQRTRHMAEERGIGVFVVDPEHVNVPLAPSPGDDVTFTAVVPASWPTVCAHDENECSIGLRIDYGASSVLFTGDAEHEEELALVARGPHASSPVLPVTLLQVAHHGSETSSTPMFLSRTRPRYAVISAGRPDEGLNRAYCHPRALVVSRLSRILAASPDAPRTTRPLVAFDGERCDRAAPDDWLPLPASARLWATERDGDVTLTTDGDGLFTRSFGE